jgi:hypothetical protein
MPSCWPNIVAEACPPQRVQVTYTCVVLVAGLGSSVSALHLLQRNRDALLTGLSRPSSSSSSDSAAAVYLWDLRKPERAAASLDLPAAAPGSGATANSSSCVSGSGGVCSLTVHEDGVLAAAGCGDGTVLVWDMRKVSNTWQNRQYSCIAEPVCAAICECTVSYSSLQHFGICWGLSTEALLLPVLCFMLPVFLLKQRVAVSWHHDAQPIGLMHRLLQCPCGAVQGCVQLRDCLLMPRRLLLCAPALQPSTPLAACLGHQGRVTQATFLPAAAAAAAAAAVDTAASASTSSSIGVQQHSRAFPLLLTGSDDWTARLWDATSGSCQAVCVGHGGPVTAATTAVSASQNSSSSDAAGVRLVTGAADGTVGVWGLRGELHGLSQQHSAPVCLLAQGGETVVSGGCNAWCC